MSQAPEYENISFSGAASAVQLIVSLCSLCCVFGAMIGLYVKLTNRDKTLQPHQRVMDGTATLIYWLLACFVPCGCLCAYFMYNAEQDKRQMMGVNQMPGQVMMVPVQTQPQYSMQAQPQYSMQGQAQPPMQSQPQYPVAEAKPAYGGPPQDIMQSEEEKSIV